MRSYSTINPLSGNDPEDFFETESEEEYEDLLEGLHAPPNKLYTSINPTIPESLNASRQRIDFVNEQMSILKLLKAVKPEILKNIIDKVYIPKYAVKSQYPQMYNDEKSMGNSYRMN